LTAFSKKLFSQTKGSHQPGLGTAPFLSQWGLRPRPLRGESFKFRRPPLGSLAFFTFGDIFYLSPLKKGLHSNFPAAGTKEFLGRTGCTGVFTGLGHSLSPYRVFIAGSRRNLIF
jgi:hypothetical protein